MKDKVFTVIIPTYNRSHLVLETLDSLIEQTYRPIEIILIDDGSTDNTNEVVENWKMINDDDIKLSICIIYQKNMGPSAARNRGIQESSGAYILFLDSDDKLYPQCLEIFVAAFKSRKADLIICGYDIFDDYTGQIKKKVFGRPDENQIELVLRGNLVVFPLRVAFTQCLVSRVGIWAADMKTGEDREYIERALCLANNPIGIRDILGALRRGTSNHLSHYFSQAYRVRCEETLLRNVCRRRDISIDAINSLISRITRIGCKLNTLGFTELGLRCADAVSICGIPLSFSEQIKIVLCRSGKIGGTLYAAFIWLKQSRREN